METPTASSGMTQRDNTAVEIFSGMLLSSIITLFAITGGLGEVATPLMPSHTNTNVCRRAPHFSRAHSIILLATCATRSHSVRQTPPQAGAAPHTNRQNCANFGTQTQSAPQQTVARRKAAQCLTQAHRGTQLRCECVALMP